MRSEQDGMMLVRADLCDRLEALRRLSARRGDCFESVKTIRAMAEAYGLVPVARLAEALERAMQRPDGTGACPRALYFDRLQDAIGCRRLDEAASEAIIASVSVRFT